MMIVSANNFMCATILHSNSVNYDVLIFYATFYQKYAKVINIDTVFGFVKRTENNIYRRRKLSLQSHIWSRMVFVLMVKIMWVKTMS